MLDSVGTTLRLGHAYTGRRTLPCSGRAVVCPPRCEQDQDGGEADEEAGFGELERPEVAFWLVDDVEESVADSGCRGLHMAAEEAATAGGAELMAVHRAVHAQD